jgi:tripartite-type tricarboxylate transporter receptor subunit TctC
MLLGGTTPLVLYPLLQSRQVYDARKDFTGVGMVAYAPLVLVVSANSNIRAIADLVKGSKTAPMAYASSGSGTAMNIAGELFKSVSGADLLHIPYKGSPPALNALMGGEVSSVFDLVASAKPFIDSGRVRALAVLSGTRSSALPQVPTLQEIGYRGIDFSVRYALVVAKGTPGESVARLNTELNTALRDPALARQLKVLALDVMPGAPDAVMDFAGQEIERLGPVVKANGIKLD